MKIKEKNKEKSLLAELRSIRDKISDEIKNMTPQQIVEYLKKKKTLHSTKVFSKTELDS